MTIPGLVSNTTGPGIQNLFTLFWDVVLRDLRETGVDIQLGFRGDSIRNLL